MRLLVIEDDVSVSGLISRAFTEDGFNVEVAEDGDKGFEKATAGEFDCIILDIMLPRLDGVSLCKKLRLLNVTVPILMLTAKSSTGDKVDGLKSGADDYVVKPFSIDELFARVNALIRRNRKYGDHLLRYQDLELDLFSRTAKRSGGQISLSNKEMSILECLMRQAGSTVSERELISRVWGLNFDPGTNVVSVYLHHLRRKVDNNDSNRLIHTVRGQGYRLGDPS